jgi:hypothetical protein
LFELHQPSDKSPFVRTYYLNETETETLHQLRLPACNFEADCLTDQFFDGVSDLIVDDWTKECQIRSSAPPSSPTTWNEMTADVNLDSGSDAIGKRRLNY